MSFRRGARGTRHDLGKWADGTSGEGNGPRGLDAVLGTGLESLEGSRSGHPPLSEWTSLGRQDAKVYEGFRQIDPTPVYGGEEESLPVPV